MTRIKTGISLSEETKVEDKAVFVQTKADSFCCFSICHVGHWAVVIIPRYKSYITVACRRGLCPIILKKWISYSKADFRINFLHILPKWVFNVRVNQICFIKNLESANIVWTSVGFGYKWKELILQEEEYLNSLYEQPLQLNWKS